MGWNFVDDVLLQRFGARTSHPRQRQKRTVLTVPLQASPGISFLSRPERSCSLEITDFYLLIFLTAGKTWRRAWSLPKPGFL